MTHNIMSEILLLAFLNSTEAQNKQDMTQYTWLADTASSRSQFASALSHSFWQTVFRIWQLHFAVIALTYLF